MLPLDEQTTQEGLLVSSRLVPFRNCGCKPCPKFGRCRERFCFTYGKNKHDFSIIKRVPVSRSFGYRFCNRLVGKNRKLPRGRKSARLKLQTTTKRKQKEDVYASCPRCNTRQKRTDGYALLRYETKRYRCFLI